MLRAFFLIGSLVLVLALGSWGLRLAVRPTVRPAVGQQLSPEQEARLRELRQRIAQDPTNIAAVLELANFYYDLGRFAEAVPLYRQYLAADPGQAEVRIDFAYALFASGEEEAGVAELHHVLERFPDHPIALFNLGVLLAQQGKMEQARQSFEELIRLHPALPLSQRARQALRMLDSLQQRVTVAQ
ncbi:MAG: tetratricopeptide repeat protein [Candidatus Kapabacteria bacterium]|nr:tetratricopeptide repeat protein [Candidatus Kapabacteria bacterium]MDW7996469.1 tetratricopeptide repeat protein [Bacteroidota bacterium]